MTERRLLYTLFRLAVELNEPENNLYNRLEIAMNPSRKIVPGLWTVAAVFPVLLLLCPQASAASDALTERADTQVRPYARAGGGVFFLDMSESSPFIRTNNREEVVGFLDHYDAAFQAGPLVNLAVGGEYNAFGKNLFTELSGFLTFYNSRHVNDYNEDSAPWTEGTDSVRQAVPTQSGRRRVSSYVRDGTASRGSAKRQPGCQVGRLGRKDRWRRNAFRRSKFCVGRSHTHQHEKRG